MVLCPGCGQPFSRGYLNHLWQTHKPECHAVLDQHHGDLLELDSDVEADNHNAVPCHDSGIDNEVKDGYLGINMRQDTHVDGGEPGLGDEEEYNEGDLEDKGDIDKDEDEEPIYNPDDYQEWEALIPDEMGCQAGMDIDEPEDEGQDEGELYRDREVRCAVEEEFQKTPIVEPFPSIEAGTPIANVCHIPKYKSYQRDLVNSDNPWAPFSLQLDWEVTC
jgi:hypothetical protein